MSVHRALRMTGLATGTNLLLSLVSAVLIARLLTPAEIGIFSVAVSVTAFSHILREFGVGQYFLQLKELSREHLRAGFTAMLLTSWTLAALIWLLAAPVSRFYRQPGIGDVFEVLAMNFMILPFGSHVLSQLKRDLQFDRIALVSIVNGSVQVCTTLLLAWHGHGAMSMAWGSLAGNVANVLCLWVLRPDVAWLTPSGQHLKEVFRFGSRSSSASLMGQLGASAPDLILGRTQSVIEVAQYSRACGLLSMVVSRVDTILIQVFTPVFAQRLRSGGDARELLAQTIRVHSGASLPLIASLAVISEPLTLLMFGSQWQLAASLAPLLLGYAALVSPWTFAEQALIAGGHVKEVLRASLLSNGAQVAVLLTSAWWALPEVMLLMGLARLLHGLIWSAQLRQRYGFGMLHLMQSLRPSLPLLAWTLSPMLVLALLYGRLGGNLQSLFYIALQCALASAAFLLALARSEHPLRVELPGMLPALAPLLRALAWRPTSSSNHTR